MARPMPFVDPVMRAFFPVSPRSMVISPVRAGSPWRYGVKLLVLHSRKP